MDFFEVKIGDQNNREWRAILKKEEDMKYKIISSLNEGGMPKLDDTLNMHLVNVHLPEDRRDPPFELDLIYWKDDISLDAFKPNNSSGSYYLISNRMFSLLSKFKLPHHFSIPVNLINDDQSSDQYLLLFLKGRMVDYINYSQSTYVLETRTKPKTVVQQFGKGTFASKEAFFQKKTEYRRNDRLLLNFDKVALTVDFDILWGIPNVFYVNDAVKKELEYSIINGIEIQPIKTPVFLPKSEY